MDLPELTTTTTSATAVTTVPTTTSTTIKSDVAVVTATNKTEWPVKVWVGAVTEHEAILQPGQSIEWSVTQPGRNPDSGGAVAEGTFCGPKWYDVKNLVGGHRYTLDVTNEGYCPLGQPQPKMTLTDKGDNTSKSYVGLIPDANHALLYVVNKYNALADVKVNDDNEKTWSVHPGQWGDAFMLATSNEHGDGVSVTKMPEQCGWGDSEDFFKGGHVYRLEVRGGQKCNDETFAAPNLLIVDITGNSQRSLDPSQHYLPTTG